MKKALENGRVSIKKVKSNRVIEIEEYEDEGAGYIFDIGNGKILFLKGQRFFPADESMEWPNSEFEIVRTVHGNLWIGIFCYGKGLEPAQVIPTSKCKQDIVWADREDLLNGNVDDFAHSITTVA